MKSFKQYLIEEKVKILYHGTDNVFENFDFSYVRNQLGFHFGNKKQALAIYGSSKPKYLIKATISIKNPLRLEDLGSWYGYDVLNMINKKLGTDYKSDKDSNLRKYIIKAGYDSVVYKNEFEGKGDSYIVFFPEQIKILGKEKL